MRLVTQIKKDADVYRIAEYIARLPLIKEFEDVIEQIEIVEET